MVSKSTLSLDRRVGPDVNRITLRMDGYLDRVSRNTRS